MMEKFLGRSLFTILIVIVCALALAACGGSGSGSTTVQSVAITPTAISLPINTQADFTATVTLTDSTVSSTTTVTWEVNGIAGGDINTVGSIVPSSTSELVGVYTAPPQVPTTSSGSGEQVGQLNITAVATQPSTTTTGTAATVTSNTAIVTVGVGLGLAVTPLSVVVPAGSPEQFSATFNSVLDTTATWTATSPDRGNIGSIDVTGLFTAPDFPPPGGIVTITATHTGSGATVTATATATIVYSDHSLNGPYAFSYQGNDQAGLLSVAGSFVADGDGHVISGVEDVDSLLTGVSTQVQISQTSTYQVGTDGRGTATIVTDRGTDTWKFVLTTNQHAQIVRFDNNANGGGTIDQQSLDALTNLPTVISGSYVFAVLGSDASFHPLGMAGAFTADGSGAIPSTDAILDVNDNGISGSGVTVGDTTLSGSYSFDSAFPGTGRGTLLLTSATTGSTARAYAFYVVGAAKNSSNVSFATQLRLVEIDGTVSLAGNVFSASTSPAGLASGNYAFTSGGRSSAGAYASGGVFVSNGSGTVTSGIFDSNSAGTYNNGPALASCAYAVNGATGRIDLKLFTGTGACPTGASSSVLEFAAYPTSQGTALMLELDSAAVSTGVAYLQCSAESAGCANTNPSFLGGSFALGLTGQGIFHNSAASYQSDLTGQASISGTGITGGNLDVNNFGAAFAGDPIAATGSSVAAPASTGRGTAVLAASNPAATYNLIYYLIDDDTALLFGQGASPIATGVIARQF